MLKNPRSASLIAIYATLLTLEIGQLLLRASALPKWQLILAEILHLQVSRVYKTGDLSRLSILILS
ncbi:hypothetical protein [Parashewanella tropica]|uniref:hypothetical protein n=1 Tax=Parashewanella tropica TaxID=2547970 RepID=UPI001059A0A6|nr:hypothetical protein [Parashewanella tropica]